MKHLALAVKGVDGQKVVDADIGRPLVPILQLGAKHHHQAGLRACRRRET